jgi:hypothetical protein
MRSVVLIGTSHKHQLPENPEADAFRTFIKQLYAIKAFQAIAEEMSLEELANRNVTRSICTQIANELGVCHQYCDPDKEQRSALGLRHKNIIKPMAGYTIGAKRKLSRKSRRRIPFESGTGWRNCSILIVGPCFLFAVPVTSRLSAIWLKNADYRLI